jgi:hypothetical protein
MPFSWRLDVFNLHWILSASDAMTLLSNETYLHRLYRILMISMMSSIILIVICIVSDVSFILMFIIISIGSNIILIAMIRSIRNIIIRNIEVNKQLFHQYDLDIECKISLLAEIQIIVHPL